MKPELNSILCDRNRATWNYRDCVYHPIDLILYDITHLL